jgi:hypothetical protein
MLIQFHLCFYCDWQAAIARAKSNIYNEENAQYCEVAYWDQYNVHGLCEIKKEFYKSFEQATSKKASEWNIEGDRTDIQIMKLWLIPNLCDWRSYELGLMGNEVTSDHGKVLDKRRMLHIQAP